MADFIQLKKDNILRIGIKDTEGNDTGEHLEFDLEDIEFPLKINECYDPVANTWTTRREMSIVRLGMASSATDGKIYCMGGGDYTGLIIINECYIQ